MNEEGNPRKKEPRTETGERSASRSALEEAFEKEGSGKRKKVSCWICGWRGQSEGALSWCKCGRGPLCVRCYFHIHRPGCPVAPRVEAVPGTKEERR